MAPPRDLRDWVALLEREGELVRVAAEVDPDLEITEVVDRVVKSGGPALLFERPKGSDTPTASSGSPPTAAPRPCWTSPKLISVCARMRGEGAPGDGIVWAATAAHLGTGALEAPRAALRERTRPSPRTPSG